MARIDITRLVGRERGPDTAPRRLNFCVRGAPAAGPRLGSRRAVPGDVIPDERAGSTTDKSAGLTGMRRGYEITTPSRINEGERPSPFGHSTDTNSPHARTAAARNIRLARARFIKASLVVRQPFLSRLAPGLQPCRTYDGCGSRDIVPRAIGQTCTFSLRLRGQRGRSPSVHPRDTICNDGKRFGLLDLYQHNAAR